MELVNRHGQAIAWSFVGDYEDFLTLAGVDVTKAVIQAARQQEEGKGDFVDSSGMQVLPKDLCNVF